MKNVVLARIDDRLIHGQVITAWIKTIKAQSILIIDEALSNNIMMQRIYKASAPTNIELVIKTPADAVEWLSEDNPKGNDVIILVKTPERLEELVDQGINIKKIILGGMGSNNTRKQFVKNVFANDDEVGCMKRLIDHGVEIVFQLVPDDKPIDLLKIMK